MAPNSVQPSTVIGIPPKGIFDDGGGAAHWAAIIDDALRQEVKRRQEMTAFEMRRNENSNALNRAHRRRLMLSGFLVFRCCGAGYTIMAKDRYGCAKRRSKGTCANDRTISRMEIVTRILKALKQNLQTAELVAEFTRLYQEEVNRLTKEVREFSRDRGEAGWCSEQDRWHHASN